MDFSISSAPAPKSCLPKTAGACHGESSLFQSSTARKATASGNGADFLQEPLARNNLFLLDGLHEQSAWLWRMQDNAAH